MKIAKDSSCLLVQHPFLELLREEMNEQHGEREKVEIFKANASERYTWYLCAVGSYVATVALQARPSRTLEEVQRIMRNSINFQKSFEERQVAGLMNDNSIRQQRVFGREAIFFGARSVFPVQRLSNWIAAPLQPLNLLYAVFVMKIHNLRWRTNCEKAILLVKETERDSNLWWNIFVLSLFSDIMHTIRMQIKCDSMGFHATCEVKQRSRRWKSRTKANTNTRYSTIIIITIYGSFMPYMNWRDARTGRAFLFTRLNNQSWITIIVNRIEYSTSADVVPILRLKDRTNSTCSCIHKQIIGIVALVGTKISCLLSNFVVFVWSTHTIEWSE